MEWSQVCEDKILQDLPYKIELNEWGNIVMTPASNQHGNVQTKIAFYCMTFMQEGTVLTECSVETSKGVKVADVVWASEEFLKKHKGTTPYSEAPEVCVEVTSPSNTEKEMEEKMKLYFEKGAREFWLCDEQGNLSFYTPEGRVEQSDNFPQMPCKIIIDA